MVKLSRHWPDALLWLGWAYAYAWAQTWPLSDTYIDRLTSYIAPHTTSFVNHTQYLVPRRHVLWQNVSSSLDIKKRNKISNRGNPYKIPIGVSIGLLSYPLIIIFVEYPIKKAWINLIIQSSKPLFFKIYISLLYNILLKAPLRSKLSIDIIHPR